MLFLNIYGANNDRSAAKLEKFFVGAIIGRTISFVRAATWLYLALVCWNRLQATSLLSLLQYQEFGAPHHLGFLGWRKEFRVHHGPQLLSHRGNPLQKEREISFPIISYRTLQFIRESLLSSFLFYHFSLKIRYTTNDKSRNIRIEKEEVRLYK